VRPAGTAPYPRPLAHSHYLEEVTVDKRESSVFRPSEDEKDTHPHACTDGLVFLTYTVFDEDLGDEVERIEALPCRRCVEATS
jgi:hypothetical protein